MKTQSDPRRRARAVLSRCLRPRLATVLARGRRAVITADPPPETEGPLT
jgi:hypothetical protein